MSSYHKDLNLVKLVRISKIDYKMVCIGFASSSGLLQNFHSFIEFIDYLADYFHRLEALTKASFVIAAHVCLCVVSLLNFLLYVLTFATRLKSDDDITTGQTVTV